MAGQLRTFGMEQKISRRGLLRGTIAAAAIATTYKLTGGVSLNKPPLVLRSVMVGRGIEDMQLLSEHDSTIESDSVMTMTPEGKLLFEPSGEFFTPGREFRYIHRANDLETIHKAYAMGANLFDIDANDVYGTVYAEHGIVPQVELDLGRLAIKFRLPAVVDVNEKELKIGMPGNRYEELVACVGSLSTGEYPLAVSTELKRGKFEQHTLNEMLAVHQRYKVPAIIKPSEPGQLEFIGSEIAQSNGVGEVNYGGS